MNDVLDDLKRLILLAGKGMNHIDNECGWNWRRRKSG
jgi:hypothetical protein